MATQLPTLGPTFDQSKQPRSPTPATESPQTQATKAWREIDLFLQGAKPYTEDDLRKTLFRVQFVSSDWLGLGIIQASENSGAYLQGIFLGGRYDEEIDMGVVYVGTNARGGQRIVVQTSVDLAHLPDFRIAAIKMDGSVFDTTAFDLPLMQFMTSPDVFRQFVTAQQGKPIVLFLALNVTAKADYPDLAHQALKAQSDSKPLILQLLYSVARADRTDVTGLDLSERAGDPRIITKQSTIADLAQDPRVLAPMLNFIFN